MTLPIAAAAETARGLRGRTAVLVGALALAAVLGGGGAWMALKKAPEPALPATPQTQSPAAVPEKQVSAAPVPAEQPSSTAPENTAKTEAVPPSEPRKEKPRAAPPELTIGPPAGSPSSGRGSSLFSAADVPGLLARADSMAARGAYDEAISLYQEIIKVDPKNQSAREGLARAKEARNMQR